MINLAEAANRLSKRDGKSIFMSGDGESARLVAVNGPWKTLANKPRPVVVILPPFAEEMNRCRRLLSLTQSALAQLGTCSINMDYFGTGDSAGEFSDARLAHWEGDVRDACALAKAAGAQSITLAGFRFGALLASQVAPSIPDIKDVFAIAPQDSFQRAIRQFIRIAATTQDASATSSPGLRAPGSTKRLESGETLEIGGYQLSAALYNDFTSAPSTSKTSANMTVLFVGSGTKPHQSPSATERRQLASLSARSNALRYSHVNDAQMWYQGVPDEPRTLPKALAQAIEGTWPTAEYTHA